MSISPSHLLDGLAYLKSTSVVELPALVEQVRNLLRPTAESGNFRPEPAPGSVELSIALQRVFDMQFDRILWEGETLHPFGVVLFGRDIRFDPFHGELQNFVEPSPEEIENEAFISVRAGSGLATALGLLQARSKFDNNHWVVVVLSEQQFHNELNHETVKQIANAHSRFLLVIYRKSARDTVVKYPPDEGIFASLKRKVDDAHIFSDLDVDYLGPVDGGDVQELAEQMLWIRRNENPTVLHVEFWVTSTESLQDESVYDSKSESDGDQQFSTRSAGINETGVPFFDAEDSSVSVDSEEFFFSEESLQHERDLIQAVELSPEVESWIEVYSQVGHRTKYLWKWCFQGLELLTLSGVLPDLRTHVYDTKLLGVMLGVLFDDVADQQQDSDFLEELLGIPNSRRSSDFTGRSPQQQAYAQFTCDLWDTYMSRLQEYPCFELYSELLHYDHRQILNAMRYSQLVNSDLSLLNLVEHDLYLPHNMQMMSFATIDLMCSPNFRADELGRLREAIWHAQCMGRIGNLVSTWRREIVDKDFTSGVFARSLMTGDLNIEQLVRSDTEQIEIAVRRGGHEAHFLNRWKYHRNRIMLIYPHIQSVDLAHLLRGLDRLIQMELCSRGLK